MAKRIYRKNTVKGSRKGQKWPEQTRTAALCDLLVGNNICAVARRYGVPESTLRSWMTAARKAGPDGEKSLFEQARAEQLRAVGHLAAAGARASVEYMQRRLEINARDVTIYEQAQRLLDEADGIGTADREDHPQSAGRVSGEAGDDGALMDAGAAAEMEEGRRKQLMEVLERHRPMNDHAAANYLRTLTGTVGRAADILKAEQAGKDGGIEFVLSGSLEELGG